MQLLAKLLSNPAADASVTPSFLLGGPINITLPISLRFGKIRTGSLVLSAGIYTEKLST